MKRFFTQVRKAELCRGWKGLQVLVVMSLFSNSLFAQPADVSPALPGSMTGGSEQNFASPGSATQHSELYQGTSGATEINPALLKKAWPAKWITCPDVNQRAYGIYHFRKKITLATKPDKFLLHISADNRYRFFVNGKPVCFGPARGDFYNWYYESIDVSKYLKAGENTLAAVVWNMAELASVAQFSNQTAFVVQGDGEKEKIANTDKSWKVYQNTSYHPVSLDNMERLQSYMVIGPGDYVKASKYPWNWEKPAYNDLQWKAAEPITSPEPMGSGTDNRWTMVPRSIPLMPENLQRFDKIRRSTAALGQSDILQGKKALVIPAGKKVSILLDQGFNTVAYPEIILSQGKGAKVKLTYAETLFKNGVKGNRDEVEGKTLIGNYDIFEMDGSSQRLFRPLWQRTYRYLQLDITTAGQSLTINDIYGMATGYPFEENASFTSNDPSLKAIWNVGWRTAKLCAGETYYDCPYYEQLQYEGDTRIQALISLYVSGDDRLMRKAINDFYNSRVPEGLTQGRYPSNRIQVIPPFSLYWISMLHDYMMLKNDNVFLKKYMIGVDGILNWYKNQIDTEKNMLGPMEWWHFTDWSKGFTGMGVPPGAEDGNSSILSLQYAYTLKQAADLYKHFGQQGKADECTELAKSIGKGTLKHCYDPARGLVADSPEKTSFSQHANIMAVLSDAIDPEEAPKLMSEVLKDNTLIQATFYYRFYLNQALKHADMGNLYYGRLDPWRDMLKAGLTTFAENPDPSRSDCHAWSASPNYDFLATICGITPLTAGFETVQVKPELGELTEVSGRMPSPKGEIAVSVSKSNRKDADITVKLPAEMKGELIWGGKKIPLNAGENHFNL
ncbi:alpha-L-rhamnosidase N-terminal domain-containing protein [Pedobacter sp. MC2016-15]|uniref:alpha-L-rhamnosidase-related protein n=1 Tax=Pedobacter sp. MC2016-15 TaxID=2994473 RepID=UPI0022456724|nr:alpha-L-rhamnosidase N-terminal domain-containing protein [Pedobacter sp. MC2016-15]MCX2477721.1 alpha-L-rhamnosidase N-terminal domain-containing protein [Pedobacter sp. MC2016-15]